MGDGRSALIWRDRWLHTVTTFLISSPKPLTLQDPPVNSLIDMEKRCWNSLTYQQLSVRLALA